jgi:hypothetical protein
VERTEAPRVSSEFTVTTGKVIGEERCKTAGAQRKAIPPPGQEGWLRQEENIAKQRYGADGVVD